MESIPTPIISASALESVNSSTNDMETSDKSIHNNNTTDKKVVVAVPSTEEENPDEPPEITKEVPTIEDTNLMESTTNAEIETNTSKTTESSNDDADGKQSTTATNGENSSHEEEEEGPPELTKETSIGDVDESQDSNRDGSMVTNVGDAEKPSLDVEECSVNDNCDDDVVDVDIDDEEAPDLFEEEMEVYTVTECKVDGTEKTPPSKTRGRKFKNTIPLHVLGRDITNPTSTDSNGGRIMPRARIGVKVPSKNLTSQIVSKSELEQEVYGRLTQNQGPTPEERQFARSLTKRLSHKLAPTATANTASASKSHSAAQSKTQTDTHKSHAELLAVLEDDEDKPKETVAKDGRAFGVTLKKSDEKKGTVEAKIDDESGDIVMDKTFKTYARKRKTIEDDIRRLILKKASSTDEESSSPSSTSNVYVTKSSRIIKKKIIWDPDDNSIVAIGKKPPQPTTPATATTKDSPISPTKSAEKKTAKEQDGKIKSPTSAKKQPVEDKADNNNSGPAVDETVTVVVSEKKTTPTGKGKRLTEVDRLLMDEGAVNMLNDVNKTLEAGQERPARKSGGKSITLDVQKALTTKTGAVKNDVHQNQTSSFVKKKDSPQKKAPVAAAAAGSRTVVDFTSPHPSGNKNGNYSSMGADASRIIRRRSSSSFSSEGGNDDEEPLSKIVKRNKESDALNISVAVVAKKKPKKKMDTKRGNSTEVEAAKTSSHFYQSFNVSTVDKLATIQFNEAYDSYVNCQIITELTNCLIQLDSSQSCHAVILKARSGTPFCLGIDYTTLIGHNIQERKSKAENLASALKSFFKCLLNFSKILIAGIDGHCSGLGVTFLSLFDMVLATDKAAFSTPNIGLNCITEGATLLTPPFISNRTMANALVFSSKIVSAIDAVQMGLIYRRCNVDKFDEELGALANDCLRMPIKSIEMFKKHFHLNFTTNFEAGIDSEAKLWMEQWISVECQRSFATFVKIA